MHPAEMQKSVSVQVDSDFALLLPSGVYEIKKMEPRSKLRKVILFCLLLSLFGMVAFGYFCPDQVCAASSRDRAPEPLALSYGEAPGRPLPGALEQRGLSYDEVLHDDFRFDLNAHDVMVFLHIQKTGGTSFGKHLVMDLDLKVRSDMRDSWQDCGTAPDSRKADTTGTFNQSSFSHGSLAFALQLNRGHVIVKGRENDAIVFALTAMKYGSFRDTPLDGSFAAICLMSLFQDVHLEHSSIWERNVDNYSAGSRKTEILRNVVLETDGKSWLFWLCGLHADFTELTACVGGELDRHEGSAVHRRYFYITLLREPVARYLSEYRHVKRGATWKGSRHWCQGRTATAVEVPSCYSGETWRAATLDEFAACPWNLANNRQTRMLADLALVGCYNGTLRHRSADTDRVLLASAKRNLAAMAYFGLTEYQKISQYVFEETFNLRFAVPFSQHNATVSGATLAALAPAQVARVRRLNALDLELYEFAKDLMFKRFEALKKRDADFEYRWLHLGEVAARGGATEFDWDSNLEDATTEHARHAPAAA